MRWNAAIVALAMALTACAAEPAELAARSTAGGAPTAGGTSGPDTRYTASLTVLEGQGHGPQLCEVVAISNPPQCGGPDVVGWSWDSVPHESLSGVRWGWYEVVGTWDGSRLTLTEPPREPTAPDGVPPASRDDLKSPCPEPEGGWRAIEPDRTTQKAMERAIERASEVKAFAGAWIDSHFLGSHFPTDSDEPMNVVLNLRFTGDPQSREAWIREVWGGPLCLSRAERDLGELTAIQARVASEKGVISTSTGEARGMVRVRLWLATDELRERLDREHGKGAVQVESVLRPVG
jgi:hypothetical protein